MFNIFGFNFNCSHFFSFQSFANFLERKIVWIQLKSSLLLKNRNHNRVVEKICILSACVFASASLVMLARKGDWIGKVKQKYGTFFSKFFFVRKQQRPVSRKLSLDFQGEGSSMDLNQSVRMNEKLRKGELVLTKDHLIGDGWFALKTREGDTPYFYNLQSGEVLDKQPAKTRGGVDCVDGFSSWLDCSELLACIDVAVGSLLGEIDQCLACFDFTKNAVHLKYCETLGVPQDTILDLRIYTEIMQGIYAIASGCPNIKDESRKWTDLHKLKNSTTEGEIEALVNAWAVKNPSHIIVTDVIKKGGIKDFRSLFTLVRCIRDLLFTIERLEKKNSVLPTEMIGSEIPFHRDVHSNAGDFRLNAAYNKIPFAEVKFCHILFPSLVVILNGTSYGIGNAVVVKV